MKLSQWFDYRKESPVNFGRYECELTNGMHMILEWERGEPWSACIIKRWRGMQKDVDISKAVC